jgi:two-component system, chemotaxis family, response regulator Rcp1
MMVGNRRIDILLVQDNPGDVMLITEAMAETAANPEITSVRDGIEAMKFLRGEVPFQDAPKPAIIILDLNLPRKDGREVLAEIKSDPGLANTPVIVFSGSDAPQDISTCYGLHANCYIVKPRDLFGMTETIRSLVDFWLTKVKLPSDPPPDGGSERENAH